MPCSSALSSALLAGRVSTTRWATTAARKAVSAGDWASARSAPSASELTAHDREALVVDCSGEAQRVPEDGPPGARLVLAAGHVGVRLDSREAALGEVATDVVDQRPRP